MALTPSQKASYQKNGYLVLEGLVPPEACARLRERANRLVADFEPAEVVSIFTTKEQARKTDDYFMDSADRISFFFEEDAFDEQGELRQAKAQSINKIGHAIHDLDPVFKSFSHQAAFGEIAADIGFRDPRLMQSMYIFKQPRIGGEVNPHQDATFLYSNPISVTGFWFALEAATLENGCLWALPGGHELGLKSRFVRDPQDRMVFEHLDETPYPETGWQPLEVPEGTLVLLNGLLPHKSQANRSGKSRHAYTLHVVDGACDYPAENWLQRDAFPATGFETS